MFNFLDKKKRKSYEELFLEELCNNTLDEVKITSLYLLSNKELIDDSINFETSLIRRNALNKKIFENKNGVKWLTLACTRYFSALGGLVEIEDEINSIDCFLNTYWFVYANDAANNTQLVEVMDSKITPQIRRYYEIQYNIDVYTGVIIDAEKEVANAYKEHFYKASFAFNQGNGDLALSIQEWRMFLNALHSEVNDRPRVIYDFAKEVVNHKNLFSFLAYCIKIERIDAHRNSSLHAEGTPLESILQKVLNAVYAMDEDYGSVLKSFYI